MTTAEIETALQELAAEYGERFAATWQVYQNAPQYQKDELVRFLSRNTSKAGIKRSLEICWRH
jgi:hypothetical protein